MVRTRQSCCRTGDSSQGLAVAFVTWALRDPQGLSTLNRGWESIRKYKTRLGKMVLLLCIPNWVALTLDT